MTTIVGMLRKALPNATLRRAYGRGQVWWYLMSKKSGNHLRGHRSSVSTINKLKEKFETWEAIWMLGKQPMSYFFFIIRDEKDRVLGAALVHEYSRGEGGCVLIDEIILDEKSLPAFHERNKKDSRIDYNRVR